MLIIRHTRQLRSCLGRPHLNLRSFCKTNEVNPWKEQKDPNGSSSMYWWNPATNATTPLGYPKPKHWIAVTLPDGSTYWWDKESNTTTAVGVPKPNAIVSNHLHSSHQPQQYIQPQEQQQQYIQQQPQQQPQPPHQMQFMNSNLNSSNQSNQGTGSTMMTYFMWGAGMTLAITAVRGIIGF